MLNKNKKIFKIIAHLPLNNSPVLEGVDLLPPLNEPIDFAEMFYGILKATYPEFDDWVEAVEYKKHKATTKVYSEEDIFGFLKFYNSADTNKPEYRYKHPSMDGSHIQHNNEIDRRILAEYLQSFNPRPKYFVAEIEGYKVNGMVDEATIFRIKTTTDNQGRAVWCGKYE